MTTSPSTALVLASAFPISADGAQRSMIATDEPDDESTVPAVSRDVPRSLDLALATVTGQALAPYTPRTFEALLPTTGHDWNAVKEPVFTGDCVMVPDTFAVRRADTKQHLGVVGSRYHITQPMDLARDLDKFFEGLPVHLEGALTVRKGSTLVLTASLPDEFSLRLFGGKDITRARVVCDTSFDGGSKTNFGLYGLREVCTNGLKLDGLIQGTAHGIRHTKSSNVRRSTAIASLRDWAKQWQGFTVAAERLSQTRLLSAQTRDIVTRVVLEPDEIIKAGSSDRAFRDATAQKQRKIETIIDITEHGMGTQIVGVRGSAWGVLQAVSEYTNHYAAARGTDAQRANRRIERVIDGDDLTIRAFDLLTKL